VNRRRGNAYSTRFLALPLDVAWLFLGGGQVCLLGRSQPRKITETWEHCPVLVIFLLVLVRVLFFDERL
jgi:hypothetical protein